jgi:hypothetical protein
MPSQIGLIKNLKPIKPDEIYHVLEPGELGCVLEWQVADTKTGKVIEHVVKKSESYVQQFLQLLYVQMADSPVLAPVLNVRDTSNTLRSVCNSGNYYNLDVFAAVTSVLYGIVVGTGAVAPTISDYVLGTLILHDAAPPTANRLQYAAVSFGAPAADATTSQLTITRNFANSSGGAITVNEVGLYCRGVDSGATTRYFMIIRDTTGGIIVPNGQTLTVNYRPQAVI